VGRRRDQRLSVDRGSPYPRCCQQSGRKSGGIRGSHHAASASRFATPKSVLAPGGQGLERNPASLAAGLDQSRSRSPTPAPLLADTFSSRATLPKRCATSMAATAALGAALGMVAQIEDWPGATRISETVASVRLQREDVRTLPSGHSSDSIGGGLRPHRANGPAPDWPGRDHRPRACLHDRHRRCCAGPGAAPARRRPPRRRSDIPERHLVSTGSHTRGKALIWLH
jgi:hypothetical protein